MDFSKIIIAAVAALIPFAGSLAADAISKNDGVQLQQPLQSLKRSSDAVTPDSCWIYINGVPIYIC